MNNINKKKPSIARQIAFGGIINLLTIVSLYLASTLPTNKIFLLGLSSFFLSIIVMEFGTKSAFFNYVSVSILGLLILPNKLILISYISFLGYYGIIKFYIEKIDNFLIEWIIKLIIFNAVLYSIYYFMNLIFLEDISVNIPMWALIIIGEIIFIVYDYAYTIAIWYYKHKLKNIIKS